ncbi:MAG: YraN family protein [bacterium]|nr:YraN family protein [bacterium]
MREPENKQSRWKNEPLKPPNPLDKSAIGALGEKIAAQFLKQHHYKIIDQNWRATRWGEIDIIATKDDTLVFVEVKTRAGEGYGEPQEAITPYKIRTLKRAGYNYKLAHPQTPEAMRLDAVSVFLTPDLKLSKILLFENIG